MLSVYLALNNEHLQQKLISFVTKNLSEKVDSKVSLNAIEWNFPNSFVLKDVYIEDQSRDTLLFVSRAKVTIDLLPLLQKTVSLRTVQMTEMEAHICKGDSGRYNFQFFVDAFSRKDSTAVQWSADIESIAFDNCAIAFHNELHNSRAGWFNPDFIEISALKGSLHVRHFSKDSLNVKLHNIGFKELSGLELSRFSTTLIANSEKLRMYNFVALMPNSRLSLHNATFLYRNPQAFKRFTSEVFLSLEIAPSGINLKDLAAFVPAFHALDEELSVEGRINGTVNQLLVRNLALGYGKNVKMQGDFSLNGLPDPEQLFIRANIRDIAASSEDISSITQSFTGKNIKLPVFLDSLGIISYKGEINGSLAEMQANGAIHSAAGLIHTDVLVKVKNLTFGQFSVNGKVEAKSFDLTILFGKKSQLGNSTFNLKVDLERQSKNQFSLNASGAIDSLDFRKYCYKNMVLNGKFDENGFDGSLVMNDKNIDLIFKGNIDLHAEKPFFRFVANVQNAQLANLNLAPNYPNSSLNFNIETNLVGKSLDDMEGALSVDNLLFAYNGKEIFIDNISLTSTLENHTKKLTIYSDYVNGQLTGMYQFAAIPVNLYNMAHRYIPAIVGEKPQPALIRDGKNDFEFRFTIDNMEFINETVGLPFVFQDESVLSGFYNDSAGKFRVRIDAPQIQTKKATMGDFTFLCENPDDYVKIMLRATHLPSNRRRNPYFISLNSKIKNDSVSLDTHFSNSTEDTYSGSLSSLVVLKELAPEGLSADIFINPTEMILNDTVWNLHRSKITVQPQKIEVDNFYFNHENQFLKINGSNSLTGEDDIRVWFSDLQLGYISDILNQKSIAFDGIGDGDISVFGLLKKPYFEGDLNIYDASINSYLIGDLKVNTAWKEAEKCIAFDAELQSQFNGTKSQSDIYGGVFLGNDSLFIEGKMKDVDLKFLRQYLYSVLQNNTGTASGTVRAYGKFGHIGLEGNPVVRNMAFDVDYLKTSYVFSDTVFMTHNSFRLNQTPVYDPEGNYAVTSGLVLHEGFKNFKFAVDAAFSNLLALNTHEQDNEMFYGKAYAGGKINISGTPQIINFNLDLRTRPNTRITIPIAGVSSAGDTDFITFVESTDNLTAAEKRRMRREKIHAIQEDQKNSSEINLNINLDATPDAQVQLIMDAKQGDAIRATGTGNLRLNYNSKDSDFKMYGGYEISKGEYLFTIQSIISRKFDILEGSLVRWTGSPYDAFLDIRAKYTLNVSPNEIIEDPNMRTTLTPVYCLLDLTGTIRNPNIKFDLEFPNADEELRRQVRSIINTEEAMNRNVASLLALGHFYTADRATATNSSSDLSSVGFSTLSSQLSSWISMIDNDLNFDLNYRPATDGVTTSPEVDVALSTPLWDDRLFFRGNFGYREGVTNSPNVSNSIVDFDLEYKLTKNGKFRVKGFNRSNNSYFKQNPNTQGVGIIYREDFDTFSGLLKSFWNPIGNFFKVNPKKPEETEIISD
jgi:hypothetical protein